MNRSSKNTGGASANSRNLAISTIHTKSYEKIKTNRRPVRTPRTSPPRPPTALASLIQHLAYCRSSGYLENVFRLSRSILIFISMYHPYCPIESKLNIRFMIHQRLNRARTCISLAIPCFPVRRERMGNRESSWTVTLVAMTRGRKTRDDGGAKLIRSLLQQNGIAGEGHT